MVTDRTPTEIDEPGWHWLRVKHVTGFPRNARDGYFPKHGVTRPAATREADLPRGDEGGEEPLPADAETVADADRLALETTYLSGKWLVERPPETVDDLWEAVVEDVAAERFWDAKVVTRAGCEAFGETEHAVLVFTPNYFDRADVDRVRRRLREAHGVTEEVRYRPDAYTLDGGHEERLGKLSDSAASRFRD
ncbi:putative phosphothreonine lyase domain-containg protein [Halorubrum yunnanense]|uniref:Phosphothreonine lyase domain-containing protein n=1 Tax=Halorubrum yunnanense TaxID=1526162 RepID=A0ABD5Y9U5_9EURY|nr:putative phosphothreonine lyase domain-containg protein [Halorubrum yunnanense]